MDFFEYLEENDNKTLPLSVRVRPKKLSEFVGQEEIIGEKSFLYNMIKNNRIVPIILVGPSGVGKTSIANIIANEVSGNFVNLNATNTTKKELEDVIEQAKKTLKKTIVFIDEIHRFNKAMLDYLLPVVENQTFILIGATTENPYAEINKALLSRVTILELKMLTECDIYTILVNAIKKDKYISEVGIDIEDDAIKFLAKISNGDVRYALNTLEMLHLSVFDTITKDVIKQVISKPIFRYDKEEEHYNLISAFIKSMRGSDKNAAIYYLARLIHLGEDINFIARRIVICASEDVGLGNSNALVVATSAMNAIKQIGLPEARIILAHAVAYVCDSKKDNTAYMAINKALNFVKENRLYDIPYYLKDNHFRGDKPTNYINPHYGDDSTQDYLPIEMKDIKFFD